MSPVRTAIATAASCCLLVLAACTGGTGGTPARPSVPPISNAKDATYLEPCSMLTPAHRQKLSLGPGTPGRTDLGTQCVWRTGELTLALTLYVGDGGLAALAATSEPAAQRVRIQGYPALETFTRGGAYCRYDVGVSERQVVVATMEGGEPSSCAALQEVLSYALNLLPPQ